MCRGCIQWSFLSLSVLDAGTDEMSRGILSNPWPCRQVHPGEQDGACMIDRDTRAGSNVFARFKGASSTTFNSTSLTGTSSKIPKHSISMPGTCQLISLTLNGPAGQSKAPNGPLHNQRLTRALAYSLAAGEERIAEMEGKKRKCRPKTKSNCHIILQTQDPSVILQERSEIGRVQRRALSHCPGFGTQSVFNKCALCGWIAWESAGG